MIKPLLQVSDVSKRFSVKSSLVAFLRNKKPKESIVALDNISFEMGDGEITGLVGPNGAGKTTLMRILADLLLPDSGEVLFDGYKVDGSTYSHRQQVGYVSSDERSFFWRLTGQQNLAFFARLYGLPSKEFRPLIDKTLNEFGLMEKSTQLFRDYSAGTRKKFVLIRALLHQPRLLLLDELTNSLDPPAAQHVKSLVRCYVDQSPRRVALWSTHRLEEIDQLCDNVITLRSGQIVSYDKLKVTKVSA